MSLLYPLVSRPSLSPPFDDPILIFAIAMVVFLAAPLIFERYRLPGIIGIIIVGAIVGPNVLGLLERDATFVLLGEVGLVYLMFIAGLEININDFLENKNKSIVFGAVSFLIPQLAGTAVGYWFLGFDLGAAALYAAIFSSHTLLAYPVVNQLGIAKNEAITAVIGGTILTDTAALLVLAVVSGSVEGELTAGFWAELAVGLILLFGGIWLIVPRLGQWFFRNLSEESYFEFLFVLAVLFVCAFLAEMAGVEHIIGAFLAGLALNRLIPQTGTLMNRIEFVGNALFIPFFLISVGMLVDPRVFVEGTETLAIAGSIVVLLLVTKFIAVWLTGTYYEFTNAERFAMYGLSAGQAAAALAITQIGFDLELFGEPTLNGVVLMIIVVSVISPFLTEKYGRAIVSAEEQKEYDPGEAPSRVLVALSQGTDRMEGLLNLGMLVRANTTEEPLHAVTVATRSERRSRRTQTDNDDDTETASEVAGAEEFSTEAEEHAASAEIPLDIQTTIDDNVVTGIARTIEENRITRVVIGWRGDSSLGTRLFGGTTDQLLDRTNTLVLVSNLDSPLNIEDRVVLVLPNRIASHPGFYEAVGTIKIITEQLGVSLACFVVGADAERYERLIDAVEPDTSMTVETIPGHERFDEALSEEVTETDLLVALSPRPGSRGWSSDLETLPERLTSLAADDVIICYPAEDDDSDRRRFLRME
ncbi:MAG: cation:proton antiporter [Euryarchaeota archaeon]|nr:cation:proton antiporter [Euryarchaeota archaeon]